MHIISVTDDGNSGNPGSITTNQPGCPGSNFSLPGVTYPSGSRPLVPANAVGVQLLLPNAIALAADAPSACQSAIVFFEDKLQVTYSTAP